VGAYAKGGPNRRERAFDAKGQRENVTALAAALLGYAGMRVIRQGVFHAGEAITYSMEHEDFTTRGLAYADDLIASMQVFGGSICVCTLILVILNHDNVYDHGCAPVSSIIGMLAVLAFTAAFVIQVAFYARLDELESLFGTDSCEGEKDVCGVSIRARRMYAANSSPATLWACAVGMVLFAFPYSRRCQTRRENYHGPDEETVRRYKLDIGNAASAAGWVSIFSSFVALIVVLSFSDVDSTLRGVELLILYGSIPFAWFGTSWIATGLHSSGLLLHIVDKTGTVFGFDLNYLTHWSVLVTLLLLLMLTVTMLLCQTLYASWCSQERIVDCAEILTALGLVGLVSLQLLLTLCSLGITASFGGSNVVMGKVSWPAFGMQWSSQHCLSFFFAAALVGARWEPQHPWVSRRKLLIAWFGIPTLTAGAWLIAMCSIQTGLPYAQVADMSALVVACTGAIVPWIVIGIWLC
jgi:hypothetical protein